MNFSSLPVLAGMLVWVAAGCVASVPANGIGTGTGGTGPLGCGTGLTMCRADQICSAGSCGCPAGQSPCNGVCAASCGGMGGSLGTGGSPGTGGSTGTGGSAPPISCTTPTPGRSPLRRLTTVEYNHTIRDLLTDATNPGNDFPAEITVTGDYFGNNADEQSVEIELATAYNTAAEGIATRATANATALGRLAACAGTTLTAANEEACARTIATNLLPRAYRRPVTTAEVDGYVTLYRNVRALSPTLTFASGVAAMIETVIQSSQFLYRVEFGTTDPGNPSVRKLTGPELATRLSYFLWQTMPDPALTTAGNGTTLATPAGVMTQATRLLDDPKSRPTVAFFFDNILPLTSLTDLTRAPAEFPTFSAAIGQAMRQETQRTLEYEIFENTTQAPGSAYAAGSWPAVITAPYTFVNQALFNFYGAGAFSGTTSLTGTALQKVNLNTTQRLGLLTQGGVMAGTTTTNLTNPVLRGGFVMHKLMCRNIPFPTDPAIVELATQPVPYTGWTARERYGKHSMMPVCAACHQFMDPVGLAMENYDAVGLYRTVEHATINGETRDTPIISNGMVPGVGAWANAVEMAQKLAASEEMQTCFASNWMQFAYGRMLDAADACNRQSVNTAFRNAGYNVKKMLLAVTQSDAFLYRPAP